MTQFNPPPKYQLLGVGISRISLATATDAIVSAVRADTRGYVTVTGVHGVMEAYDDPEFKDILNGSLITTPDGMPTVWGGWASGHSEMTRVYGPDLMLEVMRISAENGLRHFFYGGKVGVADLLKKKLEERFPGVEIVGTYCPPFRPLTEDESLEFENQVREKKPDIIWVGLSTPKQERFMVSHIDKMETKLMIGVGAAFDFHAGLLRQAPRAFQNAGLEWLYRVIMEPKRLWSRYANIVPRFLIHAGPVILWRACATLTSPMFLYRALLGSLFPLLLMAIAGAAAGMITSSDRVATFGVIAGTYALTLLCTIFVLASTTDGDNMRPKLPYILWVFAVTGFIGGAGSALFRLLNLTELSKVLHWTAISLAAAATLGLIAAWIFVLVTAALKKLGRTR
jgi:N-acetylglucosaminyldiphosphoundecaprenol N-acetyl-beta-D-mannosaminyltransferase